ncbi:hypothetical protein A3A48_02310 [Candidatus Curtissbacteria bacterium RIFCSPLOWO2_01_FULL_37_9]|uniref:UDP-N-acetylglucosamine pyrophosphorylase n=1 Tax=Candidatus Curtissbacteria bacterium RIFCSPLOWO2_01_FULL_37_9 TaxID=1797724 RepID=A0A1F5GS24_9BACT|nr:MAG: hypothetical protein A3A48_02310 [Candidatus Curtissbacteria bacterium RIFCSPLOWO2_01_FULL_37_9]
MTKINLQVIDPNTTYIDEDAEIGKGTTIYPNTTILGKTVIGANCEIGPNSVIQDSKIGNKCVIFYSVIKNSHIGDRSDVGPFAHLRDKANVGKNTHIGNFVEIIRSKIEDNSKIGHVSYIGDTTVGSNVNIGAGTIVANYNGQVKNKTYIEDGVFIGANTVLVAPVKVNQGAKTGAGAVVLEDVPKNTLVVGIPAIEKKKLP